VLRCWGVTVLRFELGRENGQNGLERGCMLGASMNMKRLFTCALAMMAMGVASAQTLQSVLESRYKEFAHAIERKDTKFFDGYLSPTFSADLPNSQPANRDAAIKAFSDLMSAVRTTSWTFRLSDLAIVPRGVTVKADGHLTGIAVGPDKKKHHVDLRGLTHDTWVLQGNVWMLDHVTFLSLNGTIDGKPAPIPGLAP